MSFGLFNLCSPEGITDILAILAIIIQLMGLAVLARALLSWVVRDPYNPVARALDQITEPILQPLRQVIPRMGMMDLTPLVAIIGLSVVGQILCSA